MLRTYSAPKGMLFLGEEVKEFDVITSVTHAIILISGVPVAAIRHKQTKNEMVYAKHFVEKMSVNDSSDFIPLPNTISYKRGKLFVDGEHIGWAISSRRRYGMASLGGLLNGSRRVMLRTKNPYLRCYLDEVFSYDSYDDVHYYEHPVCRYCPPTGFQTTQY